MIKATHQAVHRDNADAHTDILLCKRIDAVVGLRDAQPNLPNDRTFQTASIILQDWLGVDIAVKI